MSHQIPFNTTPNIIRPLNTHRSPSSRLWLNRFWWVALFSTVSKQKTGSGLRAVCAELESWCEDGHTLIYIFISSNTYIMQRLLSVVTELEWIETGAAFIQNCQGLKLSLCLWWLDLHLLSFSISIFTKQPQKTPSVTPLKVNSLWTVMKRIYMGSCRCLGPSPLQVWLFTEHLTWLTTEN